MRCVVLLLITVGLTIACAPLGLAIESDLSGGVFIAHHVQELQVSTNACIEYEPYAIISPDQQINRIDIVEPSSWFVLAAWEENKCFSMVQFALGDYDHSAYLFADYGACTPGYFYEQSTAGWPAPNEGTAITTASNPWEGHLVPVYYFIGYAYGQDAIIPLRMSDQIAGGDFCNCDAPFPASWRAESFGAMGLMCEGRAVYPGIPSYACCMDGGCMLLTEQECNAANGEWRFGFLECNPNPCSPHVYTVEPDGSGDYPTIQAAINAVASGDIIELADGVFTGPGNRDTDFLGKAITIRSHSGNPESCLIDCQGSEVAPHRGFSFTNWEGFSSRLESITITGGYIDGPQTRGGAVLCGTAAPLIANCVFTGNWAQRGGALGLALNSNPMVEDCTFSCNYAHNEGGAIYCGLASYPSLTGCTFNRNSAGSGIHAGYGGGIYCYGAGPSIANCTLYACSANAPGLGAGLYANGAISPELGNTIIAFSPAGEAVHCVDGSAVPRLSCCDIFGNTGGNWTGEIAFQLGQDGNFERDPEFCGGVGNDSLTLYSNSPCSPLVGPCGPIGSRGIGCYPSNAAVRYMDPANSSSMEDADILWQMRVEPNVLCGYGSRVRITCLALAPCRRAPATLDLFDSTGRRLCALANALEAPGQHSLYWDGCDDNGRPVGAGLYFCCLETGSRTLTRQIVVLK